MTESSHLPPFGLIALFIVASPAVAWMILYYKVRFDVWIPAVVDDALKEAIN